MSKVNEKELEKVIRELVKQELQEEKIITVPIGVSARHLHLTQEHLEILFGKGAKLHPKKELMGGQYAAEERVTIVGTNLRVIENVRVLGPLRKETQVEVSKTDAVKLGVAAPIRESGKIKGSAPITLVGPKGAVYLEEGCIVAKRHIHMNEQDAKLFGLCDNQVISVQIGEERQGVLNHVQVRVHPSFTLEMHIDTDEANALGVNCKSVAYIMN
ncbi:MAG: phosphate propanoyltransferase [Cellulosilyticaceae bacterium]